MSDSKAPTPSTDWREVIAPDEEQRLAGYAEQFVAIQRSKSEKLGGGRALHRKGLLALRGTLDVVDGLPAHLRHGLFAKPSTHEVWVRLSNGSADRQSDARPDVRGFSFKVHGVSGDGALGQPTQTQDFALINHEAFAFSNAADFVALALAGSKGPLALLGHLVKRHGVLGGLREAGRLKRSFDRPFRGFAVEDFFSAAPICCGPYAVKVRLHAARQPTAEDPTSSADWAAAMARHVAGGPVRYQLQLQAFVDESRTPIEDPSVPWPPQVAPFTTVAELELPKQATEGAEHAGFAQQVEQATFDPWSALKEHRPLGEIMRARKVVYYASQKARGAA